VLRESTLLTNNDFHKQTGDELEKLERHQAHIVCCYYHRDNRQTVCLYRA